MDPKWQLLPKLALRCRLYCLHTWKNHIVTYGARGGILPEDVPM